MTNSEDAGPDSETAVPDSEDVAPDSEACGTDFENGGLDSETAGPDFEDAEADSEAAGPDFEDAWPDSETAEPEIAHGAAATCTCQGAITLVGMASEAQPGSYAARIYHQVTNSRHQWPATGTTI